jgi:hypothetical protein
MAVGKGACLGRIYVGRGLVNFLCLGLPQPALPKVVFLRPAFSEPQANVAAILQSCMLDSRLAVAGRLFCWSRASNAFGPVYVLAQSNL